MRRLYVALNLALLLVCTAPMAMAKTLPEVKAMVESRAPGTLPVAEALVKAEPKNSEAWILLARARIQAKQLEKAIDAGAQATTLAPNSAQAFYWLGNAYGARIDEVGMLSKMTMAPKLRDAFETAVKLDPAFIDARSILIEFYLQAPSVVGGGIDKARAQATAIARYDRAQGLMSQARIAMYEKNIPQAIKFSESALALKPNDANLRVQTIVLYQQAKRWPEAYAAAKKWANEDPKAGKAWYQLGRIAAESGQYLADGEAGLRTYLTLPHSADEPQNKHGQYRLGQVLAKAGRKDEARAALQAALKLDPSMKEAKEALANL